MQLLTSKLEAGSVYTAYLAFPFLSSLELRLSNRRSKILNRDAFTQVLMHRTHLVQLLCSSAKCGVIPSERTCIQAIKEPQAHAVAHTTAHAVEQATKQTSTWSLCRSCISLFVCGAQQAMILPQNICALENNLRSVLQLFEDLCTFCV